MTVKEFEESTSQPILLKINGKDSTGVDFTYGLLTTTRLGTVKKDYTETIGAPHSSLRFVFKGKRIRNNDTPKKLNMKHNDVIAVLEKRPGSFQLY